MKTIILRHRRENLLKCSLAGLETHPSLSFYTYPVDPLPSLKTYLLLKVGAPPLTEEDAERGLFLLDGTWKLAQVMEKQLPSSIEARSLPPGYTTAYPRRQTECPDPSAGLSSVEALYIAHKILGRPTEGMLAHYRWKDLFLKKNDFQKFDLV
jgi:pre-rRNA-processing protein TSR3